MVKFEYPETGQCANVRLQMKTIRLESQLLYIDQKYGPPAHFGTRETPPGANARNVRRRPQAQTQLHKHTS